MKRLLGALCAALLALAPSLASASVTTTGAGKVPSGGGGGYVGPGDIVSGAKSYYGLRAYSAAVAALGTVKAVNITRASDSMVCDVVVATSGDLGNVVTTGGCTASGAASAFCNATTCTVNTWYDQITTTAANALAVGTFPTLVFNCVGTKPCITFGGAGGLEAISSTATAQPLSLSAVAIRTAGTGQSDILLSGTGIYFTGTGPSNAAFYFGIQQTMAETDSAWHVMQFAANGASSNINVDGVAGSTVNPGTNDLGAGYYIGRDSAGSFLTGNIFEIPLYGALAFSPTQQTNMCHNQSVYLSLGLSC